MKKLYLLFILSLFVIEINFSQSIYLDKERFAFQITPSVSVAENISILSIGTSISLRKKVDLTIQYSSILNKEIESRRSVHANGISGSINFWGKNTLENFPIDIALSVFGSKTFYETDNLTTTSFGVGLIFAYKNVKPSSFNVTPLIGVSFIPFQQAKIGESPLGSNEQDFSFQLGLGIFKNIFKYSKFVIEPSFFLDTSYEFGTNISTSIIF